MNRWITYTLLLLSLTCCGQRRIPVGILSQTTTEESSVTDTNWTWLSSYATYLYTADSVLNDSVVSADVAAVGDSVMWWSDVKQTYDIQEAWTFPAWTRKSASRPYVFQEQFSTGYRVRGVHCDNQSDPQYLNDGVDISAPVDIVAGIRLLDGPDYEKIFSQGFNLDDNGVNSEYSAGWGGTAETKYSSGSELTHNTFVFLRVRVESNQDVKLWFNGEAYAGGASVNTSQGVATTVLGIFSNSHHYHMDLFFYLLNTADTLTESHFTELYNKVGALVDTNQLPYEPSITNAVISADDPNNIFTVSYTDSTRTGGSLVSDSLIFTWYYQGFNNPEGNELDEYMLLVTIKGSSGASIDIDDYSGQFPDRSTKGAKVWAMITAYDDQVGYGRPNRTQRKDLNYP